MLTRRDDFAGKVEKPSSSLLGDGVERKRNFDFFTQFGVFQDGFGNERAAGDNWRVDFSWKPH